MPAADVLARTAALVDVASESHQEAAITDAIEAELRSLAHLEVERVGDNLVARTQLGRATRVVLAGHTDTVPANGNASARVEGEVLWGLGSADMKGGLAVFLELAHDLPAPAVDVTYVFYAGEEVVAAHNGLGHLVRDRPDLVAGDVAILGEPTSGELEAGCQGTMRLEVRLRGERAHTARPWMGRNAVHRLGALLRAVDAFPERRPVIDGCEFREALQAVAVSGGVAGNVVPDLATVTINHRFAPDRTAAEAEAGVRALLAEVLEPGDEVELVDVAAGARPGLDHPVLHRLVHHHGLAVAAKLGWTDVARFAQLGIPACNLGPGDPTLAHQADERVERSSLERTYEVLAEVLRHDHYGAPGTDQEGDMIEIGQAAPGFARKDQHGEDRSLEALRNTPVLLVFYPFTFTGICEGELCQLRDDHSQFTDAGVQAVVVSCDPAPSQKRWAEEQGWNFPVLSDFWPHGAISQAYGVFNEDRGCANRATVLIGADGTVLDTFATDSLGTPREAARYTEALAKL